MKFSYQYRTPDNVSHRDVIVAKSREDAYAKLKAQGIKPGHVDEAPGFFNKLFGKGKRWIAIGVLGAGCLVLGAVAFFAPGTGRQVLGTEDLLDSRNRRQIIGDSAIIEMGIRSGWANVFPVEGDRFLASFAVPGAEAGLRSTSVEAIEYALQHPAEVKRKDRIEFRQIKAMVAGMKDELRAYLKDGGTINGYGKRLVARQEAEKKYYAMVKEELAKIRKEKGEDAYLKAWERRNGELRRMGIRLVGMGEK